MGLSLKAFHVIVENGPQTQQLFLTKSQEESLQFNIKVC